jgi:hypothetical protein
MKKDPRAERLKTMPKPVETKYRALCAECSAPLNSHRGFTDGRKYDHKADGMLCEACDAKPKPAPPPTQRSIILANLDDIEEARKAGEISIDQAFGMAFSNMKAHITGDSIERFVRKQALASEGKGWTDGELKNEPKPEEPVADERRDVIRGVQPPGEEAKGG